MVALGASCGSGHGSSIDGSPRDGTSGGDATPAGDGHSGTDSPTGEHIQHVLVILLENEGTGAVYGSANAPYTNGVMHQYAYATHYADAIPSIHLSEPHYVWLEAGTNHFSDHTFTTDNDASQGNSTASTAHLSTQLAAAGISWTAYAEDVPSGCPIHNSGFYADRHNPFVFFRDIAGDPISTQTAGCAAHFKGFPALTQDLANAQMPAYSFIIPNVCDDGHGASGCPYSDTPANEVKAADGWLAGNLPAMITYANAHHGVIFIAWDESEGAPAQPFLAVGPTIKQGYVSSTAFDHSSLLKTVQEILGVTPLLGHAADAGTHDLADLFVTFP
jgi:phospholipase C